MPCYNADLCDQRSEVIRLLVNHSALINPLTSLLSHVANNSGVNKRQITDLVDQSIQINTHCFVVTADNRYILVCGFWDKSFRVYSTETGKCCVISKIH